jgi:hypothetical protein
MMVIVRPRAHTSLIQRDDPDTDKVERVKALSFLTLCTGPGNHQAWMAIPESVDLDLARQI